MTRPSGARWSSMSITGPTVQRFSTSKTSPSLLEFSSSGQTRRKVCLMCVADEDIAKHPSQLTSGFVVLSGRSANVDRIFAKVGQVQVHQQPATVGMGVGAHASISGRRQVCELVDQPSTLVEQLVGP